MLILLITFIQLNITLFVAVMHAADAQLQFYLWIREFLIFSICCAVDSLDYFLQEIFPNLSQLVTLCNLARHFIIGAKGKIYVHSMHVLRCLFSFIFRLHKIPKLIKSIHHNYEMANLNIFVLPTTSSTAVAMV